MNGIMTFDIETIPDFEKQSLWSGGGRVSDYETGILDGSVASIKKGIRGLDLDSLRLLLYSEESGKNRQGALAAISAEIKSIGGELKTASLTPEYNHVVAIGYAIGDGEIKVLAAKDESDDEERRIISEFWKIAYNLHGRLLGYNILNFDLRVLMVRSALLQAKTHGAFLPEYNYRYTKAVVDIMNARFPFMKAMKLKDLAVASGIQPLEDGDGGDVLRLFREDREKLIRYCASDVHITRELGRLYKGYLYV